MVKNEMTVDDLFALAVAAGGITNCRVRRWDDRTVEVEGNIYIEVASLPSRLILKVQGNLYLRSLTTLSAGMTLSASGSIDIRSVGEIRSGVTLLAGRDLDLRSVYEIMPGFSLSAGGGVHMNLGCRCGVDT